MKIEVGKFYKTRNGYKARIYATDSGSSRPIHGAILCGSAWEIETWNTRGECFADGRESGFDLVSEWEDPKPRMLAYLISHNNEGLLYFYPETIAGPAGSIRAPWLDEPEQTK